MRRTPGVMQRGIGLVEFALVAPMVVLIICGMVDFGRAIQANTTIAEAARQGARQGAADALSSDNPFSSYNGKPCSGEVFTQNVSAQGCLTDQGIYSTVTSILSNVTTQTHLYSATTPSSCGAPPAGQAYICIYPGESGGAAPDPKYSSCAAATSALGAGHPTPEDYLGTREEEWQVHHYQANSSGNTTGCFYVVVTVRYAFQPLTPLISSVIGSSIQLASTTATIAEY